MAPGGSPINPKLDALADNGGPTWTHKLQYDSLAIDAASAVNALAQSLEVDQRGYNRYISLPGSASSVDIGAYEYGLVVRSTSNALNTTLSYSNLTIRDALSRAAAVTGFGPEQIEFDPVAFGTITLSGSQLSIAADVDIVGPGRDPVTGDHLVTIDGNNAVRVFMVGSGKTVSISGLEITGGQTTSGGHGAGIYNDGGFLTLDGVLVTDNHADGWGGGIFTNVVGTLDMIDSTVSLNTASYGGGLGSGATGAIEIIGSTFNGNESINEGGAIMLGGATGGATTIVNSTISGNESGASAAGIAVAAPSAALTVLNSTIAFNESTAGSGVAGAGIRKFAGTATLHNTIVAENTVGSTPDDVAGGLVASSSHNLLGAGAGSTTLTGAGNQIGSTGAPIDPKLEALADNGGPTWTHKLEIDSPAIEAGDNIAARLLLFDQRRSLRFDDGNGDALVGIDIGAFELSADEYFETLGA